MIDTQVQSNVIAPVQKSVTVALDVEAAFRLFTEGIHTWWPLETHSIYEDEATTCILEGKEGGRIYEVGKDGAQGDWGQVLQWEPPHRFVMSWFPGRESATGQEVDIRFSAEGSGTRVDLLHSGWETLGDRAEKVRAGYDTGWDLTLGRYIDQANA